MVVMFAVLGLACLAGMALLIGFIANYAFRRSTPNRCASYAAVAVGVLFTFPAYAALVEAGAELVSFVGAAVGTAILSALAFPLALIITKRKPVEPDPSVFD